MSLFRVAVRLAGLMILPYPNKRWTVVSTCFFAKVSTRTGPPGCEAPSVISRPLSMIQYKSQGSPKPCEVNFGKPGEKKNVKHAEAHYNCRVVWSSRGPGSKPHHLFAVGLLDLSDVLVFYVEPFFVCSKKHGRNPRMGRGNSRSNTKLSCSQNSCSIMSQKHLWDTQARCCWTKQNSTLKPKSKTRQK